MWLVATMRHAERRATDQKVRGSSPFGRATLLPTETRDLKVYTGISRGIVVRLGVLTAHGLAGAGHQQPSQRERPHHTGTGHREGLDLGRQLDRAQRHGEPDEHQALDFTGYSADWALVTRVVLTVAIAGTAIGLAVGIVSLVRVMLPANAAATR